MDRRITPTTGIKLFEVVASDGRKVSLYEGPAIGHGFFRDDCLHVVVEKAFTDRGFVITAVMRKASAEDGSSGTAPAPAR